MKMTVIVVASTFLTAASVSTAALAASSSSVSFSSSSSSSTAWQRMYDSLNAWSDSLAEQATEQGVEQMDQSFQTNKDLFPDPATLSNVHISVLEQKRTERTAAFVSAQIGSTTIVFTDTSADEWYAPYVRSVAEQGILTGYKDANGTLIGKFGPADPVTIEQVAKSVVSAIGVSPVDCPQTPLNITSSGSWSAPYVACAEKKQWSVYSDGTVDVHRPATRSEVIATVLQAFNVNPDDSSGSAFTDVTPTMQYAPLIKRASEDNIINGYTNSDGTSTGLFGPNDSITRSAFAKIIALALQVYKK